MATVKIILWKHQQNKDGSYPLRLRICKNRKTTYISIGYSVKLIDWDESEGKVRKSHPNSVRFNNYIAKRFSEAQAASLELETKDQTVSVRKIAEKLHNAGVGDFFPFAYKFIERYNNGESLSTYNEYKFILEKWKTFLKGRSIAFNDIDYTLLQEYRNHLVSIGNNPNTRSNNFKKIRAIYNEAIKAGVADRNKYPFYEFRLEYNKTMKEKLSTEELNRIREVSLEPNTQLWHVRNIFLFSFNCMGMRFGDTVTLKKENIKEGRVEYRMDKSDDIMSIKLTTEAQEILNSYNIDNKSPADFIFPFIKAYNKAIRYKLISAANAYVNKYLKYLTAKAGINKSVSTHVARHTWAQLAKTKKINTSVIQQAFGHSSSRTTELYMKDFDDSVLDEANKLVVGK